MAADTHRVICWSLCCDAGHRESRPERRLISLLDIHHLEAALDRRQRDRFLELSSRFGISRAMGHVVCEASGTFGGTCFHAPISSGSDTMYPTPLFCHGFIYGEYSGEALNYFAPDRQAFPNPQRNQL